MRVFPEGLPCPDCDFVARHAAGLGRHRATRHPTTLEASSTTAAIELAALRARLEAVEARLGMRASASAFVAPAAEPMPASAPPAAPAAPAPLIAPAEARPLEPELPAGFRLAGGGRLAHDVYACMVHFIGDPQSNYDRAIKVALDLVAGGSPEPDDGEVESGGVRIAWHASMNPENAERLWMLRRRSPHATDPDARWTLEIQIAREASRSWAFVRHAFERRSLRPGASFDNPPEIPAVVPALLQAVDCFADGRRMSDRPTVIETHDVAELVEDLSRPRQFPIVVVSRTQDGAVLVDPDRVAATLAGLAHVVVFAEFNTSFALTDAIGKERSVFLGAVRIYHPGFFPTASLYDHPLWLVERIEQFSRRRGGFEGFLLGQILESSTPSPPPGLEKRIREAVDRQRQRDVDHARRRAADAKIGGEWEVELERAWAEEERLRIANAELLARIEELERVLEEAHAAEPADDQAFRSVGAAVEAAAAQCRTMVLLPEAYESAWASPYQQPQKIYDTLLRMDELAGAYRSNELGGGLKQAFEQSGLPFKANVSPTALGKYGREYERTYNGGRIMLGPHVAFGAGSPRTCARIYFYLDEAERTFVVGHIGQHLRDTLTG